MRKILVKLCDFLEKKLYSEPTYDELSKLFDNTQYELCEAKSEIAYLKSLLSRN